MSPMSKARRVLILDTDTFSHLAGMSPRAHGQIISKSNKKGTHKDHTNKQKLTNKQTGCGWHTQGHYIVED